jgi:hypothetical protein
MSGYNGWKNHATWNVALWLGNDEALYHLARCHRAHRHPYESVVATLAELGVYATPDGVRFDDVSLGIDELNLLIEEY